MNLKDEMKTLTDEANRTEKEKEEKKRKEETIAARESGERTAKRIIGDLPKRIKEAAQAGKTSVYEWYYSGNEAGGYMFIHIGKWAKEQGFKTEYKGNCEGVNEGQANMDYLTISWE